MGCSCKAESDLVSKLSNGTDRLYDDCAQLNEALKTVPCESIDAAYYFSHVIVPKMDAVRATADSLELITDKDYWPFPTYSDLLFY